MGCVLTIIGENLDIDNLVDEIAMPGFSKSYKGEKLGISGNRTKKYSAASITTSSAGFDDIKNQIEDTIHFLITHKQNLNAITSIPNIEYATINFGVDSIINEDRLTQNFYFPKELIRICTELDIEIELSIYKEDIEVILEKKHQKRKSRKS